ncbi:MAG: nucleotidyltransferase domain-containing protein [Hyphomicrobiaceae bacterium]
MTIQQREALDAFVMCVRTHFGERLRDIFVFGSRARGDARSDSDIDLAIIIEDGDWDFWQEKLRLSDLSYDALVAADLLIQAIPISQSDWQSETTSREAAYLFAARRDAKPLDKL